jgi:hypothetical protein
MFFRKVLHKNLQKKRAPQQPTRRWGYYLATTPHGELAVTAAVGNEARPRRRADVDAAPDDAPARISRASRGVMVCFPPGDVAAGNASQPP